MCLAECLIQTIANQEIKGKTKVSLIPIDNPFCSGCGEVLFKPGCNLYIGGSVYKTGKCQHCQVVEAARLKEKRKSKNQAQIDSQPVAELCTVCAGPLFTIGGGFIHSSEIWRTKTCTDCYIAVRQLKRPKLYAQMDTGQQEQIVVDQVTTFVSDEPVVVHEKPEIHKLPNWNNNAQDSMTHDVVAILQRPIQILNGKLAATGFAAQALPDVLFTKSPNLVNKLRNFAYLRANVRARLVFTATPFMSGKYLMWFAPYDGFSNRPIASNLTCKSGFPCVEIDIATGAPVELKIPYCSPLSHFDIANGLGYMGKLYCDPITATLEGTTPSPGAPFTLFMWFEDVELAMPTALDFTQPAVPPLFAQIATEEQMKIAKPSISAVSMGVSSTAKLFSSIVPNWSGFLKPVEWISRSLSMSAAAIGLNKPQNLHTSTAFFNLPGKDFTNMDGVDSGVVLGAAPDNSLTLPAGLFSTTIDEMDLGYVCKKPCIVTNTINWDTTVTQGTVLYTMPVHAGLIPNGATLQPTLMSYVASMFEKWAGGLKFRLAVAKTAFHSGRLRITFIPNATDALLAGAQLDQSYNWILDLSASSELEFEVPYVSNTPWKEVYLSPNTFDPRFITGTLSISVLTPLVVASPSASSFAPFHIWVSAADDFSLAVPCCPRYAPLEYSAVLEAQIWGETTSAQAVPESMISTMMFPKAPIDATHGEQMTIGEKVVNLRQLIKRFSRIAVGSPSPYISVDTLDYTYPGPFPKTGEVYGTPLLGIDPANFGSNIVPYVNGKYDIVDTKFFSNGNILTPGDAVVNSVLQPVGPLQYLSFLYTFWTGSKRYKLFVGEKNMQPTAQTLDATDGALVLSGAVYSTSNRSSNPLRVFRDTQVVQNGGVSLPRVGPIGPNSPAYAINGCFETIVYPDLDGCAEFTVPYYGKTPISLIAQGVTNSSRGTLMSRAAIFCTRALQRDDYVRPFYSRESGQPLVEFTGRTVEDFGAFSLYEAAGDDFTFGYLRGAPEVTLLRAYPT